MRVDVTPRRVEVVPGQPISFVLTIANPGDIIGGYVVRPLGVDPSWVELPEDEISLFPDEVRDVAVIVTLPEGLPAGTRRLAFAVRELTPPGQSTVVEVDLVVPSTPTVELRVDPLTVTGGRRAQLNLVATNTGNTVLRRRLGGGDPEQKVKFRFTPAEVVLGPGEHAVIDGAASARRRLFGSPAVRMLSFYLDDTAAPESAAPESAELAAAEPAAAEPAPPGAEASAGEEPHASGQSANASAEPTARDDGQALATATFVQRPMVSRGGIALVGLLAAVSIFGLVIMLALSQLVGQSAADRDLALQIAAAGDSAATTGSSGVAGTVHLLTSGEPVPGVSVAVYSAEDTSQPITTTATDESGAYQVRRLPAGDYKIAYRGAGFVQLWYEGATTEADATTVTLEAGELSNGLDVRLGGVPASISGTITGEDVAGATVTLETVPSGSGAAGSGAAATPVAQGEPAGAIVQTVPVGSDGSFALANVPSPSVYQIRVSKTGYATSTQRIDVAAGETRKGVEVSLRKGDGVISGTVSSAGGPLGQATIKATAGQTSLSTVSLTKGDVGSFTLRGLPTPATVTVTASRPGYASQTLTLSLAEGQKLTGVSLTLPRSSGSLQGTVSTLPRHRPAPGVTVSVTNGSLTVSTQTESTGDVGSWQVGRLPVPGTYTVTFSHADLLSQTVSVSLDSAGNVTPGSYGAQVTQAGIEVGMQSSTAVITGTVQQRTGPSPSSRARPVGEVQVELSSGQSTYTVTTASAPRGAVGRYRIENLPPGTYTVSVNRRGTSPVSEILRLRAGESVDYDPVLSAPASIVGSVRDADGEPVPAGWVVQLYVASQYPAVVSEETRTGSGGRFRFDDVEAPQAFVVVARRGSSSPPAASVTTEVRASRQRTVTIRVAPDG